MIVLGIESSCDETAASLCRDGREVLSSVVNSQIEAHREFGGVVPEIASRMHTESISTVVKKALSDANADYSDIDAVAVTYAPGLIGALLTGVSYAKGLALSLSKPLIPVHHLRGHIAANYITHKELLPPYICLVASGGHSHIVKVISYTEFEILGRTRDDAAGEAFDKAARVLGLSYPGGAQIEKMAQNGDKMAYKFPKVKFADSPYDFSFSGVKTNIVNLVHNLKQKGEDINIPDIAASFNYTVASTLCEKLMLAADNLGFDTVAACGGVSANNTLRNMLQNECDKRGKKLYIPALSLCGDNAAMIAAQGFYEFMAGNTAPLSLNGFASLSIE